eukprot:scaffold7775_cov101-Isochrysis_galbana.AAC.3
MARITEPGRRGRATLDKMVRATGGTRRVEGLWTSGVTGGGGWLHNPSSGRRTVNPGCEEGSSEILGVKTAAVRSWV